MYLWSDTRNLQIESFVNTNPFIADVREKFIEYENIYKHIEIIPKTTIIGPIQINLGEILVF